MDPQAALHDLLDAFSEGDRAQAIEYLDALLRWLEKGGAMPEVDVVYDINLPVCPHHWIVKRN